MLSLPLEGSPSPVSLDLIQAGWQTAIVRSREQFGRNGTQSGAADAVVLALGGGDAARLPAPTERATLRSMTGQQVKGQASWTDGTCYGLV